MTPDAPTGARVWRFPAEGHSVLAMGMNYTWSDLSTGQQRAVVAVSAVELALTTAALIDLVRRPAEQVRGPKALWAVGVFVQPIGPVAYFAGGIKWGCCKDESEEAASDEPE